MFRKVTIYQCVISKSKNMWLSKRVGIVDGLLN